MKVAVVLLCLLVAVTAKPSRFFSGGANGHVDIGSFQTQEHNPYASRGTQAGRFSAGVSIQNRLKLD